MRNITLETSHIYLLSRSGFPFWNKIELFKIIVLWQFLKYSSFFSEMNELRHTYTSKLTNERQVSQEQQTSWNKWRQYAFTAITEIQPLDTGDKSLNVRPEYINIGTISLNKRNITA